MACYNVAPLENLVDQFEKMPGIGHKTAQRLAYYVLNLSKTEAEALAAAVTEAHTRIHYCSRCCNLTDKELCPVCASPSRDHSVICVVETPRDATAVENTHEFKGVYHVLHGSISPLNGISPEELTVKELLATIAQGGVQSHRGGRRDRALSLGAVEAHGHQGHTPCLRYSRGRRSGVRRRVHACKGAGRQE